MSEKEYDLFNLKEEYPGFKGPMKWAVSSKYTYTELFEKFGAELEQYKPLILLTEEQGEVIKEYKRLEDKNERRVYRCHDPRGYIEGAELNQSLINYISRGLSYDDNFNPVYLKIALSQLYDIQKNRLFLYFYVDMTEEEIAKFYGVSQSAIHQSIQGALSSLRHMLDVD